MNNSNTADGKPAAQPFDLDSLTRWTFDGGMTAQVSKDGQWLRYDDVKFAQARATRLDTTASASIDTPEFRALLAQVQGWKDGKPILSSDSPVGYATRKLIAYIENRASQPVQTGVAVDMDVERKRFEEYKEGRYAGTQHDVIGWYYFDEDVNDQWSAWQARATLAPIASTSVSAPASQVAAQQAAAKAREWMAWNEVRPEIAERPTPGNPTVRIGVAASDADAEAIVAAHNATLAQQAAAKAPAAQAVDAPSDEQIIAALHANGIDTYPSIYGFDAVQVSATSVPNLRNVLATLVYLASPASTPEASQRVAENLAGRKLSVDVSTGDDDAGNRIFAELTGETGSDGKTLIAIETSRNFVSQQAAAVAALSENDIQLIIQQAIVKYTRGAEHEAAARAAAKSIMGLYAAPATAVAATTSEDARYRWLRDEAIYQQEGNDGWYEIKVPAPLQDDVGVTAEQFDMQVQAAMRAAQQEGE